TPAHADDRHAIVAKIGLPGLDRIVSQVAIAGSDDRKIRTGTMCRLGEFEMTRDANELVLWSAITVGRLLVGGPSDVRVEVRTPGGHVHELESGVSKDLESLNRVIRFEVIPGCSRHRLTDPGQWILGVGDAVKEIHPARANQVRDFRGEP